MIRNVLSYLLPPRCLRLHLLSLKFVATPLLESYNNTSNMDQTLSDTKSKHVSPYTEPELRE